MSQPNMPVMYSAKYVLIIGQKQKLKRKRETCTRENLMAEMLAETVPTQRETVRTKELENKEERIH